jgi:hypothetical protein
MESTHDALAASEPPVQVLEAMVNGPLIAKGDVKVTVPVVLLATVTGKPPDEDFTGSPPKAMEDGVTLTGGATPVPLSATVKSPQEMLPATVRVPPRAPAAVGVKVTWTVQLSPGCSVAEAQPVALKSSLSPAMEMAAMVSTILPELVTVTGCGVLLLPLVWVAKLKESGLAVAEVN